MTFQVDAYPDQTFTGTVRQVRLEPVVEQNVVSYVTVIDVPNPELKLKPGMTANVSVEIARADDVLRVPNAALRFRPDAEVLQAMGQAAARRRQMMAARRDAPGDGKSAAHAGGPSVWVLTRRGLRRSRVADRRQRRHDDGHRRRRPAGGRARRDGRRAPDGPTAARSSGSPLIPQRPGRAATPGGQDREARDDTRDRVC